MQQSAPSAHDVHVHVPTVFAAAGSPSEINKHVWTQLNNRVSAVTFTPAPAAAIVECKLRCHIPECASAKRWSFFAFQACAARTAQQTRVNDMAKKDLLRHLAKDHPLIGNAPASLVGASLHPSNALDESGMIASAPGLAPMQHDVAPVSLPGPMRMPHAPSPELQQVAVPSYVPDRDPALGPVTPTSTIARRGHKRAASPASTTPTNQTVAKRAPIHVVDESSSVDPDAESPTDFEDVYIFPVSFLREMAQDQIVVDRMLTAPRAVVVGDKLYHRFPTKDTPHYRQAYPHPNCTLEEFKEMHASQLVTIKGHLYWKQDTSSLSHALESISPRTNTQLMRGYPICPARLLSAAQLDKLLAEHPRARVDSRDGYLYRVLPAMSSWMVGVLGDMKEYNATVKLVTEHSRRV
ncbi:MAG: hypothetical protein P4L81_00450 [Candidatus Pacebacteria bacterium]|nr:hypothetical protein [Candidatus Paceibacterota bacterium]